MAKAEQANNRFFPYEYLYQLLDEETIKNHIEIDPEHSWLLAAKEKDLPIFTPGWEDSTLGNIFVAHVLKKDLSSFDLVKSGPEQMAFLVDWYRKNSVSYGPGFFQIGGGIAGDFLFASSLFCVKI